MQKALAENIRERINKLKTPSPTEHKLNLFFSIVADMLTLIEHQQKQIEVLQNPLAIFADDEPDKVAHVTPPTEKE